MKNINEVIKNKLIVGAGGGKSSSKTPKEAPNTLQSRQTIKLQELLSEGEVVGVVGDTKGVFLDGTRLQNIDGSWNFPAIKYEFRSGTPDQTYMEGFPSVESVFLINTEIDTTPLVRSVSDNTVDAVRIGIRLPALQQTDTKSGDRNGYRVGLAFEVKSATGNWVPATTATITGKTISPYEVSYRIEKPAGAASVWSVRVRRTTAKSNSDTKQDTVMWYTTTEIQDIKVAYPDAAIVGLYLDAESTGGNVPARSYLFDGIICQVPTTYTPTVYNADGSVASYASYSSDIWDGTFKWSWTDDPAWVLYDVLTNERYGFGSYINVATIDIYDFYSASRYNCQLIPKSVEEPTVMEPRFTFNTSIPARQDAFTVLQSIAASFRSVIWSAPGYIRLIQDRPSDPVALLTNKNVIGGNFYYAGSELTSRSTSVVVNFNDRTNNYNPTTIREEASAADMTRYGYNSIEITPMGVTSEGQARRIGKWLLDSTLSNSDSVSFQVSWNNAMLEIGDVVEIADNWYAGQQFSGLLVSIAGGGVNRIKFDRPLDLTNGTIVTFMTFTGQEQTRTIASKVDSTTYLLTSKAGALNPNDYPNAPYAVLEDVVPRQFRIGSISEADVGMYDIVATEYDPSKYARVEQGISVTPPIFSAIGGLSVPAPQNLQVTPETYLDSFGATRYRLNFDWDDSVEPVQYYRLMYRRNNLPYEWTENSRSSNLTLDDCLPGVYEYELFAWNARGKQSAGTGGWYNLEETLTAPSDLTTPTNLALTSGGTTFNANNFTIRWNAVPSTVNTTLKDYEVKLYNGTNASGILIQTLLVTDTTLGFTREQIINWAGSAIRNIYITVRGRDTFNRFTMPVGALFTNPAPVVLTAVELTPFFQQYMVEHASPVGTDVEGIIIHHSTSSGFTPSAANRVADDQGNLHLVAAEANTTYYVRLAAYDSWSQSGLNYTSQYSVTTQSTDVGIIPDPPSNLAVTSAIVETAPGVQQARVTVTWTKSTNTDMYDLDIQSAAIGYAEQPVVTQPPTGTTGTYTFITSAATAFTVRIRSRAATNVSEWSAVVNHTTAADTIAPLVPTAFTVTAGLESASLKWTNPTANDLAAIQVWRRRITAPAVAEALVGTIATSATVNLSTYFDSNLEANVQYQYRIRAVDRSGNFSPYTALVSVTPVTIDLDIPDGSITAAKIADGAVTTAKFASGLKPVEVLGSLPTTGNTVGRTVFLTTDNKLYRWTGSAWTAAVATNDLTGQITSTQITDNSITTAKIAANAVTANEINANSVRTAILVADSITTGMIQAGAITTNELAAGSITVGKLAVASTENIFPNPTGSNNAEGWRINNDVSSLSQATGADGLGLYWIGSSATASATIVPTTYTASATPPGAAIQVTAGSQYRINFDTYYSGGGTGISLACRYWTVTGTTGTATIYNSTTTGAQSAVWTVPSTYASVMFYLRGVAGDPVGAQYSARNISVVRMAAGDLIVDGAITAIKIAAGTITGDKIAGNTITANNIAARTITANEIVTGTLTANEIAAGTITGNKIAGTTITGDKLVANTITAGQIDANSVRTAILVANSITAGMIAANQITATHVGANQIVTNQANIADGVITNAKIANATIQGAKIANGTIGTAQIGDAQITNAKIGGDIQSNATGVGGQPLWKLARNGAMTMTGANSGGWLTIDSQKVVVYDSGGTLRVRLGIF